MARAVFTLLILFLSISVPALADTYIWTGADCQITNNAQFSNAGNWLPLNPMSPPTPSPGPTDVLIFDTAYKIGSCTNNPFDDISANILGQIAHWGGITITNDFDGEVQFSNWAGLTPLQDPTGSFNVDLRIDGNLVIEPNLGTVGMRFISSSVTNKIYAQEYYLTEGEIDKNTANPFMLHGNILEIGEGFQFNSGDCNNPDNGKTGGFNMTTSISVQGDNMIDCYYKAPTVNIDPLITNNWIWNLATGDSPYFEDSIVYWRSDNILPSSYELHQNHASNTLNFDNSQLQPHASNLPDSLKVQLHQGTANFNNALINVTSFYIGNSITDTYLDSEIIFSKLYFHDSASTVSWTNSVVKFIENNLLGGGGFGYHANIYYNQNLDLTSSDGAVTLDFYPTNSVNDWNFQNYNITLNNVTIRNTLGGNVLTNVLTLNDNSGVGAWSNVVANKIIGDTSVSSQYITPTNIQADEWIDADKFSGTVSNEIEYYNITYNQLPSLTAPTITLMAGGTPHAVRNQILPAEGSTIIQNLINFTWSQEWAVDGYECQIDETADAFASPVASWNNLGNANTTYTYDTGLLSGTTDYQWRCRTYQDDDLGVTQYSDWNTPANFFYLYAFDNACYSGTAAIDYLSADTTPTGDTPVNRTIFSKLQDYTFVTYNLSDVDVYYTYNDSNYIVTDTIDAGVFVNSISTLVSNDKILTVPLEQTTYNVNLVGTLGDGSTCNTTYEFAVGAITTGGGGTGGTGGTDNSRQQTFALAFLGAILLGASAIFFYLGKKNNSEVNIYDND